MSRRRTTPLAVSRRYTTLWQASRSSAAQHSWDITAGGIVGVLIFLQGDELGMELSCWVVTTNRPPRWSRLEPPSTFSGSTECQLRAPPKAVRCRLAGLVPLLLSSWLGAIGS